MQLSQRMRYLKSDFLFSQPPLNTPVYAIQHLSAPNNQLFDRSIANVVLFSTPLGYYVDSIDRVRLLLSSSGKTSTRQLPIPKWVWSKEPGGTPGVQVQSAWRERLQPELENAFQAILALCSGPHRMISSTVTAREVNSCVPRASLQLASSVGTPLGHGSTAEPPTRQGEHRRRLKRNHGEISHGSGDDGYASGDVEELD